MEMSYSVLVVSSSEKLNQSICDRLPVSQFSPIVVATSVTHAEQLLLERQFDLMIVNSPLPDSSGIRFVLDVCDDSGMGILLLVKAEHFPDINARMMTSGVLTLSKPTSVPVILQSLMLLCGTRERLRRMESKVATIEEKMEEIRLVNRAKWILIENIKMSESEAHRYIEKQAMNRCVRKRVIAEEIIHTYQR